jgi:hypothetical protein
MGDFQALTSLVTQIIAKVAYVSGYDIEAIHPLVFLAATQQGLHTHADRQYRPVSLLQYFQQHLIAMESADFRHTITHRTNPGKDNPVGVADNRVIVCHHHVRRAHVFQGTGY